MRHVVPALAALSDPLRLRAVRLLSAEPLQVRELQRVLGAAQSRVSNHLAVLRRAGLVETRRAAGGERYVPTAGGRRLWESLTGTPSGAAFARDDARLADVLEERTATAAGEGFDALAGRWDRIQAPFYASGVREAALVRLVPRGLTVADVGCGTGLLTLVLSRVAGRVIAVDGSPEMVRSTRTKVARSGLRNVEVRPGRAESLPIASGSCDALFAFHLLRHLPRPADAVSEFARVLAPGGRAVVVELEPHGVRALRAATGSVHLGLPRETLRSALRRAGFTGLRFEGLAEPYRVRPGAGSAEIALPAYI
ncbi:MAG TPA: metalloregulator ArsR/SmtB family transcription factor, partial [Thermoanaerobaculia bacterium]|nr:metalloregulator ArsR/SmtB family transcription factor [Thermoanaerobaculia bacterium]